MKPSAPLLGRPMSLRTRFLLPVVAAALPLALFAGAMVLLLGQHQRAQLHSTEVNAAKTLAAAIVSEIDGTIQHLRSFATSPLLAAGNIAAFRTRCEEVLRIRTDWRTLLLVDRAGNQLINTNFGAEVVRPNIGAMPHVRNVIDSGKPFVSNVFATPSGRLTVTVGVPVLHGGEVTHVLMAALRFDWFDELLKSRVPVGAGGIVDQNFHFVSRNADPARYRGSTPVAELVARMRTAPEGEARTTTFEGVAVHSVWVTVPTLNWRVVVGTPSDLFGAPLKKRLALLTSVGLLVLLIALAAAWATSRRMQRVIALAADRAADVADGKPVSMPRTNMVELDHLGDALKSAASKIATAEAERDRLLVQEQQARSRAEAANRSKDEFLAMLSHELRNPVGAISNAAALLGSPGVPQEAALFAQGVITRQTAHLTHLIDDLLDVGRAIAGKIELRREPMRLCAAVEAAVESLKTAGKAAAHRIVVDCRPALIEGDCTRIEQVASNLVANAVAHSGEGSVIEVTVRREGGWAVLAVKDDGAGLEPEALERVFDLFYQGGTDLYRKGGLGIGLTLVKRIVELHGGSVSAQSAGPGRGCTFVARFPALPENAVLSVAARDADAVRAPHTIVVVDDNEDARASLQALLELEGHRVRVCADGRQGIEAVMETEPDVAIVDIGMPGMNGYEVAREIRKRRKNGTFLIALTGYGQQEDIALATAAGFDAHVVKPADLERLRRLLAAVPQAA